MRISDLSSDVCSSDLVDSRADHSVGKDGRIGLVGGAGGDDVGALDRLLRGRATGNAKPAARKIPGGLCDRLRVGVVEADLLDADHRLHRERLKFGLGARPDEHTSELQALMTTSNAVICWKKNKLIRRQHVLILTKTKT